MSGLSDYEPVDVHRQLTAAETRTHFGFWCLLAAPLFVGTDLTALSATDHEILTNDHLIEIDQDSLGIQGTPDRRGGTEEVWSKRLSDGGAAVALFNRGAECEIQTHVQEIDISAAASYRVLDCWSGAVWETTGELHDSVGPRDTSVLCVTPK